MNMTNKIELTILMPCLNEAETIEGCIREARSFLDARKVNGEILIADNGNGRESGKSSSPWRACYQR